MKNFRFLLIAILLSFLSTGNASAGWMDKINQVTGRINQTSQQVDNVNNAKNQVQSLGSKLPKPKAKNKNDEVATETSAEGFELTKTNNPIKGEWGTQKKACAVNSATCQNGLTDFSNCMHQTKGYYFRLIAANLESRLDDQDLTEEDRSMLTEDIASLNDAVANETDQIVDPDPEYPSRYMAWLTDEDQHELQKLNGTYMNEVRQDCDNRFGGMARYSNK